MEPVVNLEERIGKVVGTRKPPKDPLLAYNRSKEESMRWKRAFGTPRIPKGLYRFKTHEEADAWLVAMDWRLRGNEGPPPKQTSEDRPHIPQRIMRILDFLFGARVKN